MSDNLQIRKASISEIKYIEDIFLDVIEWMKEKNIENLWTKENTKWEYLSKSYKIQDFFIAFIDGVPAACMALTDYDEKYWSNISKGTSIFLHKLAVKREFAGKGISKEMIDFAKITARERGINYIRLDFNKRRSKLRELYEKNGFKYVAEKSVGDKYILDLYVCKI